MKLEVKQDRLTTSLFDGKLEVCSFVTGSRQLNEKYAHSIVKSFTHSNIDLIEFLIWLDKEPLVEYISHEDVVEAWDEYKKLNK